jgi:hypothetical protein
MVSLHTARTRSRKIPALAHPRLHGHRAPAEAMVSCRKIATSFTIRRLTRRRTRSPQVGEGVTLEVADSFSVADSAQRSFGAADLGADGKLMWPILPACPSSSKNSRNPCSKALFLEKRVLQLFHSNDGSCHGHLVMTSELRGWGKLGITLRDEFLIPLRYYK